MDIYQDLRSDYKKNVHHSSPFHRHAGYELYLFLNGETQFFLEKDGFLLKPGYLVPIAPNNWHKAQTTDDSLYERAFVIFSTKLVQAFSTPQTDLSTCFQQSTPQHQTVIQLSPTECQRFVELALLIQQLKTARNYGNDLKLQNALIEVLLLANQAPKLPPNRDQVKLPELVAEMLLFIDTNLKGNLAIESFANHFYMNGAYLSRYFKKFMGITLQDYIIDKRIELAKEFLLHGKNVEDACRLAGFGNYYHFIRAFKQRVGCPPGAYKKERTVR